MKLIEVKTAELIGPALDYCVATTKHHGLVWGETIGLSAHISDLIVIPHLKEPECYWRPSTDWSQGGPLIEQEAVSLTQFSDHPQWTAKHPSSVCFDGPTPLIAAMRCLVAAELGDTVQIPEELLQ